MALFDWVEGLRKRLRDADFHERPRKVSVPARRPVEPVDAFGGLTADAIRKATPGAEPIVVRTIGALLLTIIIFMTFAPIDRVVVGTGKVLAQGGNIYVQPFDRSIVRSVLVHPGDVVKQGDTLANLDPTYAKADLTQMSQKKASSEAAVERLKAEQEGKAYVVQSDDPYSQQQYTLWSRRQQEYRDNLAGFEAKISSAKSVIGRSQSDIRNYTQKLSLAGELEDMQTKLREKGYGSRIQTIGAAQDRVEAERMLAESRSQLEQATHDVAAASADRAAFIGKWRDDIGTQLVQAQNDLDQAVSYLSKATLNQDQTTLKSPADAIVLEVGNLSQGSVVDANGAAKPLFTLTPLKGATEAEIEVEAKDIGFIRVGDPVRAKFDAYRFIQHGTASAKVAAISDGSFDVADSGQPKPPFFKVRIKFETLELRNVPKSFRLIPGMTLQGDILIGRRTLMGYLMEGAMRTGSEAMREPQ